MKTLVGKYEIQTWANGFGVWYALAPKAHCSPAYLARQAIRSELAARGAREQPEPGFELVRAPEHDTETCMAYREKDAPIH